MFYYNYHPSLTEFDWYDSGGDAADAVLGATVCIFCVFLKYARVILLYIFSKGFEFKEALVRPLIGPSLSLLEAYHSQLIARAGDKNLWYPNPSDYNNGLIVLPNQPPFIAVVGNGRSS